MTRPRRNRGNPLCEYLIPGYAGACRKASGRVRPTDPRRSLSALRPWSLMCIGESALLSVAECGVCSACYTFLSPESPRRRRNCRVGRLDAPLRPVHRRRRTHPAARHAGPAPGALRPGHRLSLLQRLPRGESPSSTTRASRRPTASTTARTTTRPTSGCCSAITSPPSPGRGRSSDPCWPCSTATCRACSGWSSASAWRGPCRTCSSWPRRCAAAASRWPRSPARSVRAVRRTRHVGRHPVHRRHRPGRTGLRRRQGARRRGGGVWAGSTSLYRRTTRPIRCRTERSR